MRNDGDLQKFLTENQINADIVQLEREVRTVGQAAEAVAVGPGQIVKSILFVAGDRPILVIASGPGRVDQELVERILGLAPGELEMASPNQVQAITGFAVGTVPPMAHAQSMEVLVDQSLLTMEQVFAGGGSSSALLRISSEELLKHSGGRLIDLSGEDPGPAKAPTA